MEQLPEQGLMNLTVCLKAEEENTYENRQMNSFCVLAPERTCCRAEQPDETNNKVPFIGKV